MKYLVIFALISLAAACPAEKYLSNDILIDIQRKCQNEVGVTDDELKDLIENKPESHNVKCVRACILKKLGVMNDKGKIVKSCAKKTLMFFLEEEFNDEGVGDAIDTCNALEVSSDFCEAVSENTKCIKREFDSRGIPFE